MKLLLAIEMNTTDHPNLKPIKEGSWFVDVSNLSDSELELLLKKALDGKSYTVSSTKRDVWSNLLTILSFTLFTISIIFSFHQYEKSGKKYMVVGGGILSAIGLGIYFTQLTIGLLAFGIIAILVVVLVVAGRV